MRLSVRFNNKWLVIPCGEGHNTVQWLIEETIRRSEGAGGSEKSPLSAQNLKAVLAQSGAMLDSNDAIKEVLDNNDFVHLSCKYSARQFSFVFNISARSFLGMTRIVLSFVRSIDRPSLHDQLVLYLGAFKL